MWENISIHALHEESDPNQGSDYNDISGFQSTLSMRRATNTYYCPRHRANISIHALHEESDGHTVDTRHVAILHFNPRSP